MEAKKGGNKSPEKGGNKSPEKSTKIHVHIAKTQEKLWLHGIYVGDVPFSY